MKTNIKQTYSVFLPVYINVYAYQPDNSNELKDMLSFVSNFIFIVLELHLLEKYILGRNITALAQIHQMKGLFVSYIHQNYFIHSACDLTTF